jgi:hypothetical protein
MKHTHIEKKNRWVFCWREFEEEEEKTSVCVCTWVYTVSGFCVNESRRKLARPGGSADQKCCALFAAAAPPAGVLVLVAPGNA